MASLTQWTWVWVDSGSWWWTGRPGVLQFMGSQRVRHDWATELNWARGLDTDDGEDRLPCTSPTSWSLLKLMSIELLMSSNHLILCHPLLLLPSIIPSIRVFSNESALCITWPKYWNFSFNIISSNEYSGLISFRMDWLDLLAVQGTLKSLLQHHSSKASILRLSS